MSKSSQYCIACLTIVCIVHVAEIVLPLARRLAHRCMLLLEEIAGAQLSSIVMDTLRTLQTDLASYREWTTTLPIF